jgi:lipopolysaccharide export system permease protein
LESAGNAARNIQRSIDVLRFDLDFNNTKINKLKIAINNKFTLSIACIVLFFIGAPLGAIIRKGGLGMPVLVAIVFFLIYYVINNTGEKLATQRELEPWQGVWLANVVLIPIAFFFMIKARNDSNLFNKDKYIRIWNFIKKLLPFKIKSQRKANK